MSSNACRHSTAGKPGARRPESFLLALAQGSGRARREDSSPEMSVRTDPRKILSRGGDFSVNFADSSLTRGGLLQVGRGRGLSGLDNPRRPHRTAHRPNSSSFERLALLHHVVAVAIEVVEHPPVLDTSRDHVAGNKIGRGIGIDTGLGFLHRINAAESTAKFSGVHSAQRSTSWTRQGRGTLVVGDPLQPSDDRPCLM